MEELIIIGSGCAGMGAAIYAARAGMNPLVIEGSQPGGLITTTGEVENFPSYPEGVNGFELVWRMREQAQKFGARIESASVASVDFSSDEKILTLEGGEKLSAKKIIVATGSSPRLTGAEGEAELFGGKGVSTCATCDGAFYKGKDVIVIGGGDTACEDALFLSRFCSSVKLVHRRQGFRASQIMLDRLNENEKIEKILDSVLEKVEAGDDGKCAGAFIKNVNTGEVSKIPCNAVFVAIGHTPNTKIFKGALEMDEEGYIIPSQGSMVETAVKNVFVAGDCSDRKFRQAITASAMGCMAGMLASQE